MSSFHHAFDNRLCAQFLASTVAAHWRNALPLPAAVALWTEPLQPTRALPVSLSGVAWPVRWVGISKIVNTFFFFLQQNSTPDWSFSILLSCNFPSCSLPTKIFGYCSRWKVTPGHHPSPRHFLCAVIAWVAVCFAGCGKQVGTTPVRRAVRCQCSSPDDFHHNFKALNVTKCPDIKFQSVSNYSKCT